MQVGVFSEQDSGGLDDAEIGIPAGPQDALYYNSRADGTICKSVDPANIVMQPLNGGGVMMVVAFEGGVRGAPKC
jgi:hypothetical protein